VRPLIKMTGETGFNEVLFEDLEVEDSYRLDELGKGWQVAMTTLLFERGAGDLVTPRAGGLKSRSSPQHDRAGGDRPRSQRGVAKAAPRMTRCCATA
jgi:alkylation response protein AidB-like acyl-CoA dehydrogenase